MDYHTEERQAWIRKLNKQYPAMHWDIIACVLGGIVLLTLAFI